MQKNHTKYILQSTAYSTALMMLAGSVIQAFLLENGLSEQAVTFYLSIVQVVQVSVMLVVSLVIDRIRNVLRTLALSMVLQMSLFLSLIVLCIFQGMPITTKYILVFSAGILANIIQAVYNIINYKAPYHMIDMDHFATMSGIVGMVTGLACIAVSAAMSFFTAYAHYNTAMLCFFLFGAVMLLAAFFITLSFTPVTPKSEYSPHRGNKTNLFRYRPFYALILPNLLRGFCTGILSVAMTIGHSLNITDQASGAVLTLLLQIANVISCLIYSVIAKKNNNGHIILIASLLLFAAMPAMLLGSNLLVFYVMYFLSSFFINFINYAIPVAVTKIVDYEYIGQYSSWRMLLHTSGVALSNVFLTGMLSFFGGMGTLGIAVLCQLISGIGYFLFLRKTEKAE